MYGDTQGFPKALFDHRDPQSVRDWISATTREDEGFLAFALLHIVDIGRLRSSDVILGDLVVPFRDAWQRVNHRLAELLAEAPNATGGVPEDQS